MTAKIATAIISSTKVKPLLCFHLVSCSRKIDRRGTANLHTPRNKTNPLRALSKDCAVGLTWPLQVYGSYGHRFVNNQSIERRAGDLDNLAPNVSSVTLT